MVSKTCRVCGEVKPLEEFHRRSDAQDGRHARCRSCASAYNRELRLSKLTPEQRQIAERPPLTPEERQERERARREAAKLNPRPCVLEGCEKPTAYGRRLCGMHSSRIARHGDPDVNLAYAPDDQVTYDAAHKRVKRARGKASEYTCEVAECEAQAVHWAYGYGTADERTEVLKGSEQASPYSLDPSDYFPLCVAHHVKADREVIKLRRERDLITRAAEAEMKSRQSWADHGYVRAA